MFSVGFALEPKFFQQAPLTAPIGYRQVIRGEAGFRKTLGGKLKKMDFQKTSPAQLKVTTSSRGAAAGSTLMAVSTGPTESGVWPL